MLRFITMLLLLGVAQAVCSQEARSNKVEILVNNRPDTLPPVILVEQPDLTDSDHVVTHHPEIRVSGKVEDKSSLRFVAINSMKLILDNSGGFSTTVKLYPGRNELRMVACDLFSNLQEKFLYIEYRSAADTLVE